MKGKTTPFSFHFFLVFLLFLLVTFSLISVEATKNLAKKHRIRNPKHHKNHRGNAATHAAPFPSYAPHAAPFPSYAPPSSTTSNIFNLLSFGAKGNGISDDSKVTTNLITLFFFSFNLFLWV